ELLLVDLDLAPARPGVLAELEDTPLDAARTVVSTAPVAPYEAQQPTVAPRLDDLREIYSALVLGLRGYVRKNGFSSVLLGLSGGIDSTLVAAIAVDAVGSDRVFAVSNPSRWSSAHSVTDAPDFVERTGIQLNTIEIGPIVEAFERAVQLGGIAAENLQARIRAVLWMGLSNQYGRLVLACGNKSELACGYSTIYGDSVGGYAPIKDVL